MSLVRFSRALGILLVWVLAACQPAPSPTISVSGTQTTPTPVSIADPIMPAVTATHEEDHDDEEYAYGILTPEVSQAGGMHQGQNQAGFGSKFAESDQFILSLTGMIPPPAGQAYQGWLLTSDGKAFPIGILPVNGDGTLQYEWVSPNGENLLSVYQRFEITLETDQAVTAPQGKTFFYGGLEPEIWAVAQDLYVKNSREPATPLNRALVPGFLAQLNVAIQHIHNAENAAKIGALDEMRVHMEHTINIIEGSSGPRFKDYTQDGAAQNPGDGFGVKGYAREIVALIDREAAAEAGQKVDAELNDVQDRCEQVLALNDIEQAKQGLVGIEEVLTVLKTDAALLMDEATHIIWFPIVPDEGG